MAGRRHEVTAEALASSVESSECGIHTSAERHKVARCGSPSEAALEEASFLSLCVEASFFCRFVEDMGHHVVSAVEVRMRRGKGCEGGAAVPLGQGQGPSRRWATHAMSHARAPGPGEVGGRSGLPVWPGCGHRASWELLAVDWSDWVPGCVAVNRGLRPRAGGHVCFWYSALASVLLFWMP